MKSEYHVKKFYTGSRIIENVCVNTIDNKIDDWNKESFDTNKSFEYIIFFIPPCMYWKILKM